MQKEINKILTLTITEKEAIELYAYFFCQTDTYKGIDRPREIIEFENYLKEMATMSISYKH